MRRVAVTLLVGALGFSMAPTSHAVSPCVSPQKMSAVELPNLGIRKAKTVHRILRFPKDTQCVANSDQGQRGIVVALAQPPAQVTISSVAKRKKGMVPVQITVFDSAWRPIRNFEFSAFTQRGSRRSIAFNLDPANDPRFLLVETDLSALGKSDSFVAGVGSTVVWVGGGFMGAISNGTERTMEMPYVDSGEVDIEFTRFEESLPLPANDHR